MNIRRGIRKYKREREIEREKKWRKMRKDKEDIIINYFINIFLL